MFAEVVWKHDPAAGVVICDHDPASTPFDDDVFKYLKVDFSSISQTLSDGPRRALGEWRSECVVSESRRESCTLNPLRALGVQGS
jgi:hypothetical protein